MTNYYEILGVRDQATHGEIKRAYRKLVKIYHPDINTAPEAMIRIVEITTAYDVLSDPFSKANYDLAYFEGVSAGYTQSQTISEEELARRAYKRQRAAEEQESIARMHNIKTAFYRFQRLSCFGFLVVSILFTIDYFFKPNYETFPVRSIVLEKGERNQFVSIINTSSGEVIEAKRGVFDHFDKYSNSSVRIYYSSIFNLKAEVGVYYDKEWKTYQAFGNMHEFGNIFAYMIMLICLLIIRQKEYRDWALTIAFIPFFITLFLFLLIS